jgi:hypothetical protein
MVLTDFQVDQAQDLESLQEPNSLFLKMNLQEFHTEDHCVRVLFLVYSS